MYKRRLDQEQERSELQGLMGSLAGTRNDGGADAYMLEEPGGFEAEENDYPFPSF